MCDRCTALEIAVSEQRNIIDCQSAEIAMLKTELARCRWIIGDLQTRHITTKRERDEYKRTLDAINQWAAASTTEAA